MAKAQIVPNRAQSWIIVHNRAIFMCKPSFMPHPACSSRILASPVIKKDLAAGTIPPTEAFMIQPWRDFKKCEKMRFPACNRPPFGYFVPLRLPEGWRHLQLKQN